MSQPTGGMGHLLDMVREGKRNAARMVRATACPRDGEPLDTARGVQHCAFCGWTSGSMSDGR